MNNLKKDLSKLKEDDIINILLYGIYKLTDDQNYSSISELIYTLGKDNLFKLCSAFGGCTIKIPTLTELKNLTEALLVFQEVNFNNKSFTQACNKYNIESPDKKEIYTMYNILSQIIEEYPND